MMSPADILREWPYITFAGNDFRGLAALPQTPPQLLSKLPC